MTLPKFLTIQQVCERTHMTEGSVRNLIKTERIGVYKLLKNGSPRPRGRRDMLNDVQKSILRGLLEANLDRRDTRHDILTVLEVDAITTLLEHGPVDHAPLPAAGAIPSPVAT